MAVEGHGLRQAAKGQVERRIVSVLFADLVGFTSLSERLDAEDVAIIQDAYFAAVRDTVARHGGQLEKFIGDAAMAVYGVPRGRDDDAERAVRTGLALVEAVERLGARLDLDGGDLRLRVGVNTGEVVHAVDGPDAGRVTGDTVNTAARLQTAAEPGTVLVGEATALAVAEAVEVEAVAPLSLKGKATPVRAFRVVGVRAQRSRELAMGSLRAPTIGRDAQLAELEAALQRATQAGATERWLVLAPPGVGKTRLLEAFAAHVASLEPPPLVWRIRLRPEAAGPFDSLRPLAQAALRDAGVPLEGPAAGDLLRARLLAAGHADARAAVVADELLGLAGTGPAPGAGAAPLTDRAARFAAWLEGLDALGGDRVQVWLVEDLHWAGLDIVAFLDAASAASDHRGAPDPGHGASLLRPGRAGVGRRRPVHGPAGHRAADAPGPGRSDAGPSAGRRLAAGRAGPPHRRALGRQLPVHRGAPADLGRHRRPRAGRAADVRGGRGPRCVATGRRSRRCRAAGHRPRHLRRATG